MICLGTNQLGSGDPFDQSKATADASLAMLLSLFHSRVGSPPTGGVATASSVRGDVDTKPPAKEDPSADRAVRVCSATCIVIGRTDRGMAMTICRTLLFCYYDVMPGINGTRLALSKVSRVLAPLVIHSDQCGKGPSGRVQRSGSPFDA